MNHPLSWAAGFFPQPETAGCLSEGYLLSRTDKSLSAWQQRQIARAIALCAVRSLYAELALYPKPGLVSLRDNGSHIDMTAATFIRSLFALRHYFRAIAAAGLHCAPFSELQHLGIQAERCMLLATRGINTHRGAIFALGMLCAAGAACVAAGQRLTADAIRNALQQHWGAALRQHCATVPDSTPDSHGLQVAQRFAASGAREEAALGFPAVFELALPRLTQVLQDSGCGETARTEALFCLIAHVSDTNLYYRGGQAGADFARQQAQAWIAAGGTRQPDWFDKAQACHAAFVQRRLSPGGAADLLAASWLVHQLTDLDFPPVQYG
ncbi:triphosphoribosyl-dephospho-CoA synthase MdcB [Undibacterium oligocarboniphilum]|uniref:Probable 2-(5''-triphosphoribosyl)-3'-dephosphocoenzyme-A synthase n=1 Tax=Undibacterium oligocarboniphilum TaxID=666702 RepID=A0A850QHU1_9BURK|nr:triphosphoribosyl-dephospho-CoA synthase MdcB [Undibacterium oligocarboniphilum]MBC3871660.1 triphosphoribosyl-dephospho-CoA synthase MdcB [Undibacterium oligocarboniphilum]NVO79151.1 triphosphoribosyl-dephospho-CoA synthase MdcB [Undibacterium oligocarboniphilum]